MFLKQLDLTTALRPSYPPDEVLLFVQDNVGLYEGKYKLPNQQNGQVYLTSHRICYVDRADPRKYSVSLDLKDVERTEHSAGFLKSSPKVTIIPKATKRASLQPRSPALGSLPSRNGSGSPQQRADSPLRAPPVEPAPTSTATWVCTICSFSNPVPSNFDAQSANAHTPLPPCLACGIKPTLAHVLKAAISNATSRPNLAAPLPVRPRPHSEYGGQPPTDRSSTATSYAPSTTTDTGRTSVGTSVAPSTAADPEASFQCPRCTFLNHPSLFSCEMCGAPLISQDLPAQLTQPLARTDSPGPSMSPAFGNIYGVDNPEGVKISFRTGGDKIFFERLKGSMTQRKWLLQGAPPIPTSTGGSGDGLNAGGSSPGGPGSKPKTVGLAGLEKRGLDMRRNNELVIGSAFEDLEALMASAKEIVALAETFARQQGGSSSDAGALEAASQQLGLMTTRDTVGGGGTGGASQQLYLSELARTVAEFLTDDARGVLRRAGGVVSLVDLWAVFNRARGGVELVSPADFLKAARLWETLRLPVRLRTFRSGVMVVQGSDRTDDATVRTLLAWLRDARREEPPAGRDVAWDWSEFGRGVSAQDVAERFGWSLGVAEEELEMAEERGALCRDEGIEGLRFFENFIDADEYKATRRNEAKEAQEQILKALKESGFV